MYEQEEFLLIGFAISMIYFRKIILCFLALVISAVVWGVLLRFRNCFFLLLANLNKSITGFSIFILHILLVLNRLINEKVSLSFIFGFERTKSLFFYTSTSSSEGNFISNTCMVKHQVVSKLLIPYGL